MKLVYLAANDAYAFTTDGHTIVQLKGESRFFPNWFQAKQAAARLNLIMDMDGNTYAAIPRGWHAIEAGLDN